MESIYLNASLTRWQEMGNPNPSPKTRFETKRSEPLSEKVTVRLTASMYVQLLEQQDYREFIRQAITEKLSRLS